MLVWLGLFGLVASFHGIIIGYSRQIFALSRAGYLPELLGRIHPKLGTPWMAILAGSVVGIAAIFSDDLVKIGGQSLTANIVTLSVFGAIVMYILSMASLFKLRRSEPALERPYRAPLYPLFPAFALVAAVLCLVTMAWFNAAMGGVFAGLMALGLRLLPDHARPPRPGRRGRRPRFVLSAAAWRRRGRGRSASSASPRRPPSGSISSAKKRASSASRATRCGRAGPAKRSHASQPFSTARSTASSALEPDLVIGFSDMQAALADKLIRAGLNVLVTNQRSVAEIVQTMRLVANLVGAAERGEQWLAAQALRWQQIAAAASLWPRRPRVYFEEWDEPMISAIRWVSELIGMAGGADDVFPELGRQADGQGPHRGRCPRAGAAHARHRWWARGAARSSAPRKWLRDPAGPRCRRFASAASTRSNRATFSNPGRPR